MISNWNFFKLKPDRSLRLENNDLKPGKITEIWAGILALTRTGIRAGIV